MKQVTLNSEPINRQGFYNLQNTAKLCILIALLIFAFLTSIGFGSTSIPLERVMSALLGIGSKTDTIIITKLRLPRTLLALEAGICLAIAGSLLQATTRNPLASPAILGIVDGAAFGVVIFLFIFVSEANILTISIAWQPLAAVIGAFVFAAFVAYLTWRDGRGPLRIIIYGIAMSSLASAGVTLFLVAGDNFYAVKALTWVAGSVHSAKWSQVIQVGMMMFILLSLLPFVTTQIDQMALDEFSASATGLNVSGITIKLAILALFFTATAVSFAGGIAFIGLIAPHAARMTFGHQSRWNLVGSALIGGILIVAADLLARVAFQPLEVPTGALTAAFGAPYFIWLLMSGRKKHA